MVERRELGLGQHHALLGSRPGKRTRRLLRLVISLLLLALVAAGCSFDDSAGSGASPVDEDNDEAAVDDTDGSVDGAGEADDASVLVGGQIETQVGAVVTQWLNEHVLAVDVQVSLTNDTDFSLDVGELTLTCSDGSPLVDADAESWSFTNAQSSPEIAAGEPVEELGPGSSLRVLTADADPLRLAANELTCNPALTIEVGAAEGDGTTSTVVMTLADDIAARALADRRPPSPQTSVIRLCDRIASASTLGGLTFDVRQERGTCVLDGPEGEQVLVTVERAIPAARRLTAGGVVDLGIGDTVFVEEGGREIYSPRIDNSFLVPLSMTLFEPVELRQEIASEIVALAVAEPAALTASSPTATSVLERGSVVVGVREGATRLNAFETELTNELVQRVFGDVEIDPVPLSVLDRFERLSEVDFMVRYTTPTTSRAADGLFTNPYLTETVLIVAPIGEVIDLETFSGTVASTGFTAGELGEALLAEAGADFTVIESTEGVAQVEELVASGQAQLGIVPGQFYFEGANNFDVLAVGELEPISAWVFQDAAFRDELDAAIVDIVADGTWTEIYRAAFGEDPFFDIATMRAAPVPDR